MSTLTKKSELKNAYIDLINYRRIPTLFLYKALSLLMFNEELTGEISVDEEIKQQVRHLSFLIQTKTIRKD